MDLVALDSNVIGRYQLVAQLGQGGMATVYLAVARGPAGFHKLIVVKVLRQDAASDSEELCQMFLDEARLAARMQHPNVVQTMEVGEDQGRVFLVMEYLEGQPLHLLLRRARQKPGLWSLQLHLRVLAEALRGLHYAHELRDYDGTPLGVVHRDISPHNVFVTYDGQIKLVDFGVAKISASDHQTQAGVLKGKIGYMAPEQVEGNRFDRRADIFAAGVMLFEALSGDRLWQGQSDAAIFRHLLAGEVPDIHQVAPNTPRRLRESCAKALSVDPKVRYRTAAELQRELEMWLDTSGSRISARQAGRAAALLFDRERHEIRTLIDRCIKDIGGPRSAASTASSTSSSSPPPIPQASHTPPPTAPVAEPLAPWLTQQMDGSKQGTTPRSTSAISVLHGSADPAARPTSRSGRIARSSLRIAVVATAVLMGAAIAVLRASQHDGDPGLVAEGASPAHSAAALPPAVSQVPAAVPDPFVTLTLRAVPSWAVWSLDGVALPSNPYAGPVPRSRTAHRLRVQANGYITLDREFVADRDASFDVALEFVRARPKAKAAEGLSADAGDPNQRPSALVKAPQPSAPDNAEESAPQAPAPPPASSVSGRRSSHTVIDTSNPYEP